MHKKALIVGLLALLVKLDSGEEFRYENYTYCWFTKECEHTESKVIFGNWHNGAMEHMDYSPNKVVSCEGVV